MRPGIVHVFGPPEDTALETDEGLCERRCRAHERDDVMVVFHVGARTIDAAGTRMRGDRGEISGDVPTGNA